MEPLDSRVVDATQELITNPPQQESHRLDELMAMPHDDLARLADTLTTRLESTRQVNASLARMARQQIEREEDLTRAAEEDPLTGLLNKRAWIARIEGMIEGGESNFAVVFADLSLFKAVNDVYGHEHGDRILQKTAHKLEGCFREEDELSHDTARYGGDEFAILLDLIGRGDANIAPEERVSAVIDRIRGGFAELVQEEGLHEIGFDIAVGYAIYEPGDDVESLIKRADKAMYQDKFSSREKLKPVEIASIRFVRPILEKAGIRIPEDVAALLDTTELSDSE